MSNKLIRKKPGYTKSGAVKIISLSLLQLVELLDKTQMNKKKAKIQRRISVLKARPGYVEPVVAEVAEQAVE
jgi:hypothetical protein